MGTKVNPFDTIAKAKETKKTSSIKLAAKVTDEIKGKVDLVLHHKATIKSLEAEQADAETTIIEHVRPQQDSEAYAGNFAKSFTVEGNTGTLTYNSADSFSVPKKDTPEIEELQKLLGKKFDEVLKLKRTITLKTDAASNQDLINKLMEAITQAGLEIGDVFDVSDTYTTVDDLDRKQYDLFKPIALEQVRTLIRQRKPSLK